MKKMVYVFLVVMMCIQNLSSIPVFANSKNVDNEITTIEFGCYPQSEVRQDELTEAIKSASYDENGYCTIDGKRYKRVCIIEKNPSVSGYYLEHWIWNAESGLYEPPFSSDKMIPTEEEQNHTKYRYFKCEPIKWNVLYEEDGKFFVMANEILDCQAYDDGGLVNWSVLYSDKKPKSAVQIWLNKDFVEEAFTQKEVSALILDSAITWKNEKMSFLIPERDEILNASLFLPNRTQMENLVLPFCEKYNWAFLSTEYATAVGAKHEEMMLHSKYQFLENKKIQILPYPDSMGIVFAYKRGVCPVLTLNAKDYYDRGDADYDGSVTLKDAQLILKSSLGIIDFTYNMDLNEDDNVNLTDAELSLKIALGIKIL